MSAISDSQLATDINMVGVLRELHILRRKWNGAMRSLHMRNSRGRCGF